MFSFQFCFSGGSSKGFCQKTPNFTLRNQSGDLIALEQVLNKTKAKLVVLSIFQTTCAPCIEEINYLIEFQKISSKSKEKIFDLVLIDSKEERSVTLEFINKHAFTDLLVLSDPYGKIDPFFDLKVIPKLVVLDRLGTLIYSKDGKELSELRLSDKLGTNIEELAYAHLCKNERSKNAKHK